MKSPLVSVIIPTYNRERYIVRSVNSVLQQTYSNLEVIVVDDGSNDRTLQLLEEVKDARLKVIGADHRGANAARNRGIKESAGDLIAFNDSDAFWRKDKLEKDVNELKVKQTDVVISKVRLIYPSGYYRIIPTYNLNEEDDQLEAVLQKNMFDTATITARRYVFQNEVFDEKLPRFQDWDLGIRLVNKYHISFLDRVQVCSFALNDSITKNNYNAEEALKTIFRKNEELYRMYPKAMSKHMQRIAKMQVLDGKNGKEYYYQSFRYYPNFLSFVSFIICGLHMQRLYGLIIYFYEYVYHYHGISGAAFSSWRELFKAKGKTTEAKVK